MTEIALSHISIFMEKMQKTNTVVRGRHTFYVTKVLLVYHNFVPKMLQLNLTVETYTQNVKFNILLYFNSTDRSASETNGIPREGS